MSFYIFSHVICKTAAKLQKMFYIHNNFSEKMFYTRNIFYKKSVCHAQHFSLKQHKIAHLSVILNISKSVIILMYRHGDLHSYIGYYKTTTPKMR